ncbi:hypothetical protein [Agrobacterium sp. NPDC090283]|uniref:hypothetical protein n=1 Tax=Agrobacterium sp. NPDC090283 TaxID=3363920 RepID=UPI00383A8567
MRTNLYTIGLALMASATLAHAADERPMRADVESAAGLRNIYSLDCSQTRDGKPGYLCWYRDDNTNALGAFVRVEKGWFGWKKIGTD